MSNEKRTMLIEDLKFSPHRLRAGILRALRAGMFPITTALELCEASELYVMSRRGIGRKRMEAIRRALAAEGLCFTPPPTMGT